MMLARRGWMVVAFAWAVAWPADIGHAQLRGIAAALTPVVGSDGAHAGTEVRAALRVALPEGFHVQSDQPRDPSLIPTVLSVDPPAGVTLLEVVYPAPTDLPQIGVDEPLAVFDSEFAIGLRLMLGPAVPAGELTVPGRLRYQACDDTTCFAPTTADAEWALRIIPETTPVAATHDDLMAAIPFGRSAVPVPPPPRSSRALGRQPADPSTATMR